MGFTAIASIAFNCSVAFIRPISAVTDDPAREAKSNAATTGPSSRVSERATSTPSASGTRILEGFAALESEDQSHEPGRKRR